jgi:hypothetical protein
MIFMVPWVPIFTMLCKRVVPMLWQAYLLLGLRRVFFSLLFQNILSRKNSGDHHAKRRKEKKILFVPPFSFLIGDVHCFLLYSIC